PIVVRRVIQLGLQSLVAQHHVKKRNIVRHLTTRIVNSSHRNLNLWADIVGTGAHGLQREIARPCWRRWIGLRMRLSPGRTAYVNRLASCTAVGVTMRSEGAPHQLAERKHLSSHVTNSRQSSRVKDASWNDISCMP